MARKPPSKKPAVATNTSAIGAAAIDGESSTEPAAQAQGAGEVAKAKASHDTQAPEALIKFMLERWSPASRELPSPIEHAAAFHARRRALSARFAGEALVVPTGHEKVRANDTHYRFRPGTDFYYLTGALEPDCVLVMLPEGDGHRDVLFVEPNPGRSDKSFFTDRKKGELWVGPRLGVEQSRARFGVHECRALGELDATLREQVAAHAGGFRVLRGLSDSTERGLAEQPERDREFAAFLSEMRLVKDAVEIDELRRAVASTKRGFEDVIERLRRARSEREVEGVFNLRARVEGNDVGYNTIAACGHHACVLHWNHNDGAVEQGALLLLDAGVEGNSLYTADITRTLPVSGRFSPEQREIYELVHRAQAAAMAEVKPGNDFMAPNTAAMRVLAEGLEQLGILPTSAQEALDERNQFYKRYSLHNVSHMLGLDVHDCAAARSETYKYGKLLPGMVLTVEPGLYFQLDDLTVPERYRGIGVRIEDDVVVTEAGFENLSSDIPSDSGDVERWVAEVWAARAVEQGTTGDAPRKKGGKKAAKKAAKAAAKAVGAKKAAEATGGPKKTKKTKKTSEGKKAKKGRS